MTSPSSEPDVSTVTVPLPGDIAFPRDISGEATCRMPAYEALDTDELTELMNIPQGVLASKQERDFVLAALLLRGRHMNERSLRRACRGWTPFGQMPLRDFLLQQKVLPEETLARLEQEGQKWIQSLEQRSSWNQFHTIARRTSQLLEQIDPSGRVAKVLGLSQIPKRVAGNECREFRSKFRLLRKLGQGGLGAVWLAIDLSLNRYVAVKEILGPGDERSPSHARFRREAEITGRLDHPNIVPLHLLGTNEADGRLFYVMRFLGNETLEDAIRAYHERREAGQETPLAFHRLLTAFVNVCQAIAYAHSRKVIHRDLKPQNVALDSFGQVIVLDWGLAKVLGMEDPAAEQLGTSALHQDSLDVTMAGQVMGTPMYMAPEQAAGRVDDIDELTDVYGLGAILFSILTGYAPHELSQETLAAGSAMGALLDVIIDQPVCAPRKLNPRIPPALEAICLKAMARDRYLRYESASALSDDLQRWLADEPIVALQEPVSRRVGRWMKAHRFLSQFLGMLSLLAVTAGAMGAIQAYQGTVAAQQLRLQVMADDTRELHAKLTHEIQTLSENARFMASLPPVQDVLTSRRQKEASQESDWTDRLKRTFRGMMDVNPSYTAVTYWIDEADAKGKPIRTETPDSQRGPLRTDLTEFFGRHLPGITALQRGEIYVGMPGRITSLPTPASPSRSATVTRRGFDQVGQCLVAGVGVYDQGTDARVGGVVIECDLERLLRDFLRTASSQNVKLDLTDETGRIVMRFSREEGLRSVPSGEQQHSLEPGVQAFFEKSGGKELLVTAPGLAVAKVPLSRDNPKAFMGLIVRFPE